MDKEKPNLINNLENCVTTINFTPAEACAALDKLASLLPKNIGIGIWEGTITGVLSGNTYSGKHLGVFDDSRLIALFGPHGDPEAEAAAALLVTAIKNVRNILDHITNTEKA